MMKRSLIVITVLIMLVPLIESVTDDFSSNPGGTFTNMSWDNIDQALKTNPLAFFDLKMDVDNTSGPIIDYSNNNYNLTPFGTYYNASSGHNGHGAWEFDGSDDYAYLDITDTDFPEGITVSVWIKADKTGLPQYAGIFSSANDGGSDANTFQIDVGGNVGCTGEYRLRISNDTPVDNSICFGAENTDWTNLLFTYDGSEIKTYQNGVLEDTQTIGISYIQFEDFMVGTNRALAFWFDGSIDEVLVVNRTLNQAEINDLYTGNHSDSYKYYKNSTWLSDAKSGDGLVNWSTATFYLNGSYSNQTLISRDTSDPDLLMWLDFDDYIVSDLTGKQTFQTYYGLNQSVAGAINGSKYFDNATGIQIADSSSLDSLSGLRTPRAFCAWIKNDPQGLSKVIMEKGSAQHLYLITGASAKKGKLVWNCGGSGSETNVRTDDSVWRHYCGDYNGTHTRLWVNSVLQNDVEVATCTNSAGNNEPLAIGYRDTPSNYFLGGVDELQIYNKSLNDSYVLELYRRSAGARVEVQFCVDNSSDGSFDECYFSDPAIDGNNFSIGNPDIASHYKVGFVCSLVNQKQYFDCFINKYELTFTPYANNLPTLTTPVIDPNLPEITDTLNTSVVYSDTEGSTGTVYFQWYVDEVNVHNETITSLESGETAYTSLTSGNFSVGQQVNLSVFASDGFNNSSAIWSDTVTITNPTIKNLTISRGMEWIMLNWSSPGGNPTNISSGNEYGEMHFHNDTEGHIITISVQNEWVNITGFDGTGSDMTVNFTKGVDFNESGNALVCLFDGYYRGSYSVSAGNIGNNQEYNFELSVDGVGKTVTDSHRKIGAAGDVGNTGSFGTFWCNKGDNVKIRTKNIDGTANLLVHACTVSLQRVGG